MRPVHDPYGGVNPLIDKMIGNAYDIVKYVARYLKEIRYVAENMESIYALATAGKVVLEGVPDSGETSLSLALPVGLDVTTIQSVSVMGFDGTTIYFPGTDTFNFGVSSGGNLIISIESELALDTILYRAVINFIPE